MPEPTPEASAWVAAGVSILSAVPKTYQTIGIFIAIFLAGSGFTAVTANWAGAPAELEALKSSLVTEGRLPERVSRLEGNQAALFSAQTAVGEMVTWLTCREKAEDNGYNPRACQLDEELIRAIVPDSTR